MQIKKILLFIILLISGLDSFAQKTDKIDLIFAEELTSGTYKGTPANVVKGKVQFRQKDVLLFCDSAYRIGSKNMVEAFGHVRVLQGDSVTLTGNHLTYYGDTKLAHVTGNVVLNDKTMILTTDALDYNMTTKHAFYSTGGKIIDKKSILTSQSGYYNTSNKMLYFKNNVKVVGPKGTLLSDTLEYNTQTKIVTFRGPSQIITPDNVTTTDHGVYDLVSDKTIISGRSKVESGSYVLSGDKITRDEKKKYGIAQGHVKAVSKKDSVVIEGDMAYSWSEKGESKVFGNALMKAVMGGDTLYIKADTLYSIDNIVKGEKKMLAYNNCKIFRTDMQGICDSLVYNRADSTIYFYHDPVLWNDKNQILADSINIQMANNKIDKMNMRVNSFIISKDTLKNFNQVKGKNMTAHFFNNSISKVNIDGNGENIYFALQGDTALTGMNKVLCSDMLIRFLERKLVSITFITNPDALFIPPHEILEPEKKLKGFRWREQEKPNREMVLGKQ